MTIENSTVLTWSIDIALVMLGLALLLCVIRVAVGPTLPDRVVALDLFAIVMIGIIVTFAIKTGEWVVLDAATVLALIAFLGTVTFARYMERVSIDE